MTEWELDRGLLYLPEGGRWLLDRFPLFPEIPSNSSRLLAMPVPPAEKLAIVDVRTDSTARRLGDFLCCSGCVLFICVCCITYVIYGSQLHNVQLREGKRMSCCTRSITYQRRSSHSREENPPATPVELSQSSGCCRRALKASNCEPHPFSTSLYTVLIMGPI